jgi:hypothetical protein
MYFYITIVLLLIFALFIFNKFIYSSSSEDKNSYYRNVIKNDELLMHSRDEPVKNETLDPVIIVSLTTSPRRINMIQKTIDSILNQTRPPDLVRINIPTVFKRTGETYKIPDFLLNHPKIQVVQYKEDYGPIMKILPTIMDYKNHSNASIIYTDDDVIMLPKTIETFLKLGDINPEYVLCFSGFQFNGVNRWIRNNDTECFVNIPEGYMCVYLNNKVLGRMRYSLMDYYKMTSQNEYCFTSDDLMMGNFYAMNGIFVYKIQTDKVNFNLWWNSGCELPYGKDGDGISSMASDQHFTRYNNAYDYLKRMNINFLNV